MHAMEYEDGLEVESSRANNFNSTIHPSMRQKPNAIKRLVIQY